MQIERIKLPFKIKKPVLAFGSQAKNTVCFIKGNSAYIGPVRSDLNNPFDFFAFEKTVKYFLKTAPKIIAYDMHPEYQSTKYAKQLLSITTCRRVRGCQQSVVQHHHAHIASCMADNSLKNQKVIGVAFDGAGLGADNTLWGAEFLICDYKSFKRSAHLKEIPLLGGARAILEPWRLWAFWLYSIYKDRFLDLNLGVLKKINRQNWRVLKNMYLSNVNSPLTSSMGRLFDAAASLVLEKNKADFEAELAMELERLAAGYGLAASGYKFNITAKKDEYIIDPASMFKEIINDLSAGKLRREIAYRFHLTVAQMIKKICVVLRKKTGINKVVFSGGVFQNKLLLSLSLDLLYKKDFQVVIHKNLSCNDSGLSLGQAVIANARSKACV